MQIGRHQAHDLRAIRGFGQQVLIAAQHIVQAHAIAIRDSAGARDVAFDINHALAVGQDGGDADAIAIFDGECGHGGSLALVWIRSVAIQPSAFRDAG